jgi:hypothetical protein
MTDEEFSSYFPKHPSKEVYAMIANEDATPRGRRGKGPGRQTKDKQEAVMNLDPVKSRINELVKLHHANEEAAKDLSEAIKACAEKSGLLATVVKRYVTACAGENYEEKAREVAQLAFVFEQAE